MPPPLPTAEENIASAKVFAVVMLLPPALL